MISGEQQEANTGQDVISAPADNRQAVPPLQEFVARLLAHGDPLSQNTGENNLGFGWIYYSLVRNLRPDFVVAIGSRRGFMPCSVARACQDNGKGHVVFIDPSYDGGSHPGWGGGDFWSDPVQVKERWDFYSLTGWITHLKMTSEEAFPHVKTMVGEGKLGVVVIDGAHTYENSLQDFDLYTSLMTEGYAVFHDAVSSWCDVPKTIHTIRTRGHHLITMHREVGLAIVEIWNPPNVKNTWGYLCKPSNRGKLLLKEAGSRIRPGDRVLDVYCGYSPLGFELNDQKVFGCDRDPAIIRDLKEALPQHQWAQIEEHYLPFAALPEDIDVIVGLGVSRGHAWWDPQRVVENVRYLMGRYYPRTCIFETAAGYYGADILYDLQFVLMKLGYVCEHIIISTDMDNFSRRAVLIADRSNPGCTL